MEKLKVKHDHTLTDIIKVCIFALFLILPILVFLPNCLYYGFNEHAVVNTETKEVYEYQTIDFNQKFSNRNFSYEYNGSGNHFTDLNYFEGHANHKVLLKYTFNHIANTRDVTTSFYFSGVEYIYNVLNNEIITLNQDGHYYLSFAIYQGDSGTYNVSNMQLFDLTQMFGIGNEPTIQQFNEIFTENYYNYTLSKLENIKIDTGTTKNYTDIASNIANAWQDTWDTPMLQWTNTNAFKFTINTFTNVFGITQESKMANYLTYLLVITCIYLVFDIVLTLTTKLTHLINAK